ncbi:MAG: hypothetical protein VKO39_07420 [Cyanobacteriota bacterium]|nr:hypothetical protein [Cyanobacteriota bacterium]
MQPFAQLNPVFSFVIGNNYAGIQGVVEPDKPLPPNLEKLQQLGWHLDWECIIPAGTGEKGADWVRVV